MSTILRLIPVLLIIAFIMSFLGCDCCPKHNKIDARYIGKGLYSVAIGDTPGGQGATIVMRMTAIGDTTGGQYKMYIGDTTGGQLRMYIGDTAGGQFIMAMGDTTGGVDRAASPVVDRVMTPYYPQYIQLVAIGDTSGGQ